jgi:hypothetical protein
VMVLPLATIGTNRKITIIHLHIHQLGWYTEREKVPTVPVSHLATICNCLQRSADLLQDTLLAIID